MLSDKTIDILHKFNETGKLPGHGTVGNGAFSYVLVMEQDGEEKLYPRFNQPCYGEMRIYTTKWKPSDLHDPFPDGKPIGVAVRLTRYPYAALDLWNFMFTKDSLWGPLFENRLIQSAPLSSSTPADTTRPSGFIMTDMDFNSDYWFSLLLSFRSVPYLHRTWSPLVGLGVDPFVANILALLVSPAGGTNVALASSMSYSLETPSSFKNLLNRTPIDFHKGKFFSDRATFRKQPDNQTSRIWAGKDRLSELKLSDKNLRGTVPLEVLSKEYVPYLLSFK